MTTPTTIERVYASLERRAKTLREQTRECQETLRRRLEDPDSLSADAFAALADQVTEGLARGAAVSRLAGWAVSGTLDGTYDGALSELSALAAGDPTSETTEVRCQAAADEYTRFLRGSVRYCQ